MIDPVKGKYRAKREIFEKPGDYKESKTMVVETFYIEAKCILPDKKMETG